MALGYEVGSSLPTPGAHPERGEGGNTPGCKHLAAVTGLCGAEAATRHEITPCLFPSTLSLPGHVAPWARRSQPRACQPFLPTPPAAARHRPSPSSWSGHGSCRAPGDCHPGYTGPSVSPAPGACRTGERWGGLGDTGANTTVAPGGQVCCGSPYLAVQAQGHWLVLQCHEEGAAIQLILQVEHNSVD